MAAKITEVRSDMTASFVMGGSVSADAAAWGRSILPGLRKRNFWQKLKDRIGIFWYNIKNWWKYKDGIRYYKIS